MRSSSLAGAATALGLALASGAVSAQAGAARPDLTGWSQASRDAAAEMERRYGAPDEVTPTMLVWHDNGPWKRTVISREAVPHRFPAPHDDVMERVISYRVPPDRVDELARYDGSVIVERTRGEISARCDREGANVLALNLAHEIATGRRTVEAARRFYARQIMAMKAGRPAPYTERLLFQPQPGAMDPDAPVSAM
jgi:hypothetical protein